MLLEWILRHVGVEGVSGRRAWFRGAGLYAVVVGLLLAFVWILQTGHSDGERALEQRFVDRGALAARFARAYVHNLAQLERRQATDNLSAGVASRAAFERIVADNQFQAAVLLDASGHLLQVWPPAPQLLGRDLTTKYTHLRVAVTSGRVGISNVVPSAVRHVPIVAVAVPFATPQGRRVFSGAFILQTTPLASYLRNYTSIKGSGAYLVDAAGAPITGSQGSTPTATRQQLLRSAASLATGGHVVGGDFVDVERVEGTPWRMVLTVPRSALLRPVHGLASDVGWLLLLAFAVAAAMVLVLLRGLARQNALLRAASRSDALTGLQNRRGFDEHCNAEADRSRRTQSPVSLLVLDIDSFKQVNDKLGHAVGDDTLCGIAHALRITLRTIDVPARFGGDEFAVILPETDAAGALVVAERIREAIKATFADRKTPVTTSIGAATMPDHADSPADLLRAADRALYAAKAGGRNCAHVYEKADAFARVGVRTA
jgi:diguanylate cyclase